MSVLRSLLRDTGGATAGEFGLVAPLLVLFTVGTIDIGRFLFTYNRMEKATQMGVRFAAVTDLVPSGLSTYDFAVNGVGQGDPVPQSSFGSVTCTATAAGVASCTCVPASCPWGSAASNTAFANIVARMKLFYPGIAADKVQVKYEYSGLGYAGDPNGADVAPVVTVQLVNMTFSPILLKFLGTATIGLPTSSSALTLEDGEGNQSN